MRLIRVRLTDQDIQLLKHWATQFNWGDLAFLADLYALILLHGKGIPTSERVARIAAHLATQSTLPEATLKVLLEQRRVLLQQLASSLPLNHYWNEPSLRGRPMEVVEAVLFYYFRLGVKLQAAACLRCTLLACCAFGQRYGQEVTDIGWVRDKDWRLLLNADCPSYPEVEQLNWLADTVEEEQRLLREHAVTLASSKITNIGDIKMEFTGDGDGYNALQTYLAKSNVVPPQQDGSLEQKTLDPLSVSPVQVEYAGPAVQLVADNETHVGLGAYSDSGQGLLYKGAVGMVDRLTAAQLPLFALAHKLGETLTKRGKGKFRPTTAPSSTHNVERATSVTHLRRMLPSEIARSDDEHFMRVAKGQVLFREAQEPTQKRSLWYVVLDTSASMVSPVSRVARSVWGACSRATLAVIFVQAIARLAEQERGLLWLRVFASGVGPLRLLQKPEDYKPFFTYLAGLSFDGSGTDLAGAFRAVKQDIQSHHAEIRKAQVLVITDCGTRKTTLVEPITALKEAKIPFAVLNCLDFVQASPTTPGGGEHRNLCRTIGYLRQEADHYFQVSATADYVEELSKLVITL